MATGEGVCWRGPLTGTMPVRGRYSNGLDSQAAEAAGPPPEDCPLPEPEGEAGSRAAGDCVSPPDGEPPPAGRPGEDPGLSP